MEHQFTAENFEAEVLNAEQPVLVDFFATWCGPCKVMAPVIEELAEQFDGKVKVGKLDIDENMGIARKYRVMSVPTFLIFRGGEIVHREIGAVGKEPLEDALNELF